MCTESNRLYLRKKHAIDHVIVPIFTCHNDLSMRKLSDVNIMVNLSVLFWTVIILANKIEN
jgi:hypothetical protein